jgi:hypothetical protein
MMKTRHSLILGLIASSLMLALPAQAEHGLPAGAFLIAKRSADDASRSERADDRRRDERRASGGQNERGYGYGYERRQRDPETEESAADPRRRDREQRNERSEDRGSRSGRR